MEQRKKCGHDLESLSLSELKGISSYILQENDTNNGNTFKVPYEESELFYIIATIVASLSYLEQHGIVHGDIRPFNICVTN